jgi:hypothetical protein
MSPSFHGQSTPAGVRDALNDSRKADAGYRAAVLERERAAAALEEISAAADRADLDALAAGEDVAPVDPVTDARDALERADRRLRHAQTLARRTAAALAPAIVEAAPQWLPVLRGDLEAALGERTPGEVPTRQYLERVDTLARRYHFVRDLAEGRIPVDAGPVAGKLPGEVQRDRRPILARAVDALELIDALLGEYAAGVERAERAAAEREREQAAREAWEEAARAKAERERQEARRAKAERERPGVIR